MSTILIINQAQANHPTFSHKKRKPKENQSLLIAAQNKAVRNNFVKAKLDDIQKNSKCKLCGDRDEYKRRYTG